MRIVINPFVLTVTAEETYLRRVPADLTVLCQRHLISNGRLFYGLRGAGIKVSPSPARLGATLVEVLKG